MDIVSGDDMLPILRCSFQPVHWCSFTLYYSTHDGSLSSEKYCRLADFASTSCELIDKSTFAASLLTNNTYPNSFDDRLFLVWSCRTHCQ
jgi:hypothetical protein